MYQQIIVIVIVSYSAGIGKVEKELTITFGAKNYRKR